ncbi:MAG: glucosaminidase domain-containing protein [Christensenella sp.]|nr:glucosaminidase domain-containing protein [Christensenella sp.]
MSTTKKAGSIIGIIFCLMLTAILFLAMPQVAHAAQQEENVTQESVVVRETEVMDIPAHNGEVVETVPSGTSVEVYMQDVNDEWNAIVEEDGTIHYVLETDVALTAPAYVYQSGTDLTNLTAYPEEQLEILLQNTGLAGLGGAFVNAERNYGVNALFLISITKLESGNGNSSLAKNSNNLGGLKSGGNGYLSFDSKEQCVDYMARLLSENYLNENGKYYSGKTVKGVSKIYCEQSSYWASSVEKMMEQAYNKINEV